MSNGVDRKGVQLIVAVLLGLSAAGFFYSLNLPTYKDEAFYHSQYMAFANEPSTEEASKQFYELRNSQLTSKFMIQDYSLTLFSLGGVLLIYLMMGRDKMTAFQSKKKIIFLGICSALITSGASIEALFLDFSRGEFPLWADSLGIPIMTQELPLFILLVAWAALHSLFVRGKFEGGKAVFRIEVLKSNYWLSLIGAISLVLVLVSILRGDFLMTIPGCLWIYFYLSLASGRKLKPSAA